MSQFEIVAIGTSAGGLRALSAVLSDLSPDLPVSVLVVQHLDPRHKSLMAEILQRHCKMRVKEAEHDEILKHSIVYVAPPNNHLLVSDRRIVLTKTSFVHFVRPSIDLLFDSAAADFNDRVIGVILTGTGSVSSPNLVVMLPAKTTSVSILLNLPSYCNSLTSKIFSF